MGAGIREARAAAEERATVGYRRRRGVSGDCGIPDRAHPGAGRGTHVVEKQCANSELERRFVEMQGFLRQCILVSLWREKDGRPWHCMKQGIQKGITRK